VGEGGDETGKGGIWMEKARVEWSEIGRGNDFEMNLPFLPLFIPQMIFYHLEALETD